MVIMDQMDFTLIIHNFHYIDKYITFKCYDKIQTSLPTNSPSQIPSKIPTTKSPTDITHSPSQSPTQYISDQPSNAPTGNTPAPNADAGSVGDDIQPTSTLVGDNGNYTNQCVPSIVIIIIIILTVL